MADIDQSDLIHKKYLEIQNIGKDSTEEKLPVKKIKIYTSIFAGFFIFLFIFRPFFVKVKDEKRKVTSKKRILFFSIFFTGMIIYGFEKYNVLKRFE